jgi:hypothetical protein
VGDRFYPPRKPASPTSLSKKISTNSLSFAEAKRGVKENEACREVSDGTRLSRGYGVVLPILAAFVTPEFGTLYDFLCLKKSQAGRVFFDKMAGIWLPAQALRPVFY